MSEAEEYKIRTASYADAVYLADKLPAIEQLEIQILNPSGNIQDALRNAIYYSDWSYTVHVDETPIILFGLCRDYNQDNIGVPWLVHSGQSDLRKILKAFVIKVPQYIQKMHESYPILSNFCHVDNKTAISWLKHLGFIFPHPPIDVGEHKLIHFCRYV